MLDELTVWYWDQVRCFYALHKFNKPLKKLIFFVFRVSVILDFWLIVESSYTFFIVALCDYHAQQLFFTDALFFRYNLQPRTQEVHAQAGLHPPGFLCTRACVGSVRSNLGVRQWSPVWQISGSCYFGYSYC